jgi:hypothetical protein
MTWLTVVVSRMSQRFDVRVGAALVEGAVLAEVLAEACVGDWPPDGVVVELLVDDDEPHAVASAAITSVAPKIDLRPRLTIRFSSITSASNEASYLPHWTRCARWERANRDS